MGRSLDHRGKVFADAGAAEVLRLRRIKQRRG
jgi:hypothetical protein